MGKGGGQRRHNIARWRAREGGHVKAPYTRVPVYPAWARGNRARNGTPNAMHMAHRGREEPLAKARAVPRGTTGAAQSTECGGPPTPESRCYGWVGGVGSSGRRWRGREHGQSGGHRKEACCAPACGGGMPHVTGMLAPGCLVTVAVRSPPRRRERRARRRSPRCGRVCRGGRSYAGGTSARCTCASCGRSYSSRRSAA